MKAYVLVQTTPEYRDIAAELRTVVGVISAEDLQGPYDAIAEANWDGDPVGLQVTIDGIHQLPGVTRALVAPVAASIREREPAHAA